MPKIIDDESQAPTNAESAPHRNLGNILPQSLKRLGAADVRAERAFVLFNLFVKGGEKVYIN